MTPKQDEEITIIKYPSLTYQIDLTNNCIKENMINGLSSIEQSIYKVLNTHRFDYIVYSWNYGNELHKLIGKPMSYVVPEVERLIKEALLVDDRINLLYSFEYYIKDKDILICKFKVNTDYGVLDITTPIERG